jgi:hypothetical protein
VIEMALAHTLGDKVEAAYRRSDGFQKRLLLAEAWAAYCGNSDGADIGDEVVVPLRRESLAQIRTAG